MYAQLYAAFVSRRDLIVISASSAIVLGFLRFVFWYIVPLLHNVSYQDSHNTKDTSSRSASSDDAILMTGAIILACYALLSCTFDRVPCLLSRLYDMFIRIFYVFFPG